MKNQTCFQVVSLVYHNRINALNTIVYKEVDITSTCMLGKLQVPSRPTTLRSQRIDLLKKMFRQETNQLLNCSFLFNYVILTNYVILNSGNL